MSWSTDMVPLSPTLGDEGDKTCRVCRSGEEPGSPLYKPCKCSGSISWIHQDCLESWLSVSRAQRCELCKHPFKWEKVYATEAPQRLPPFLILRHVFKSIFTATQCACRVLFVAVIWGAFLPYTTLWVWRGLFHLAKGWGASWTAAIQEVEWSKIGFASLLMPYEHQYVRKNATSALTSAASATNANAVGNDAVMTISRMINVTVVSTSMKPKVAALNDAVTDLLKTILKPEDQALLQQAMSNTTTVAKRTTLPWLPRSTIVDSIYIAIISGAKKQWTAHKGLLYALTEDVVTGQTIVCYVVVAFISTFLLREWVMSNQPNARNDPLPGPAQQARQARRLQEHIAQLQAQPDDPDDPLAAERRAFFEELRRGLVDPPPAGDPNWPPLPPMGPTRVDQPEEATQAERHTARERSATPYPESPSSNHEEEVQDSLVRRRAWGSDRQGDQIPRAESPFTFQPFSSNAETSPSASQQISSESTASSATSPVMPVLPSAAVSMRRSASNDFGIESIADSDFENAPLNAPLVLPAPAPNAARNRNHRHGLRDGDDTDTEDEDMWDVAAVPRPADAAARAGLENDPVLFDGDENPDDLFFEADMHGILEAVGIQGPIIALLQNVALVSLLIACLLVVAVWIPLMTGKTIAATNAHKIVLVPVNAVRLFTDPLADRFINLASRPKSAPTPSIQSQLTGFLGRIAKPSIKPSQSESFYGQLKTSIREHLASVQAVASAFTTRSINAIKSEWYQMAVGDRNIDRALCIALGFSVIIAGAGLYLRYTRNVPAREGNVNVREIIRQQFTLLKAGSFFFVEIVFFPAMCGLLLNLATLPSIPGATIALRTAYYMEFPVSAWFLTWLAGTNFMFSFAQAISIVRKCIRKGVLYFIRDPSDPNANPLREILETSALNQAKKIGRSLLVYGGIVLTCFGFFPWLSRIVSYGIFPLRYNMLRPMSSYPLELVYLLVLAPWTIDRLRSRRALRNLVKKWCEYTAHQLRLSSFMLGKRRADEEGSHVRKTWKAWLLSEQAPVTNVDEDVTNATLHPSTTSKGLGIKSSTNDELNERRSERESGPNTVSDAPVVFQKDGGFARTVAADNVKIVPGKMFVRTDQNGNALTKEGEDAIFDQLDEEENQESMFTIVYIPPNFKARILTFIGALWVTGCIGLFVAFCTPLLIGRFILDCIFNTPIHDTYSILAGLEALVFFSKAYRFISRQVKIYRRYMKQLSVYPLGASPTITIVTYLLKQSAQMTLLAINGGIIMPLLIGITAHLYIFLPVDMLVKSLVSTSTRTDLEGGNKSMEISLSMQWCYGIVLTVIAVQIAPAVRNNFLIELLREIRLQSISKTLSTLNKQIFRINRFLLLAIALPISVTYSHHRLIQFIWVYILNRKERPTPTILGQEYIFKIALLSVSSISSGFIIRKPMKKLLDKWLVNVWESEFVIRRKLKNIDDNDGGDDDVEVENGERKQEDGEVMHGLNRIVDGNEERERGINGEQQYQGGEGHGQDQMEENDRANIIPEIDIVD